MSPRWEEWKFHVGRLPGKRAAFEKWFFVHLAGVLFGGKAGELIMLSPGLFGLGLGRQAGYVEVLSRSWNCSALVLSREERCVRMVIYDPARVRQVLDRMPRWAFDAIGHRPGIGPREFLEEVGRRWRREGRVPHEIGLALGYPVKDVLGFMGVVSLPCTGRCGWRIHGCPNPSLLKSRMYRQAREAASAFLEGPAIGAAS
jgi:hypothetical protein